jgi:hypothetical protein
MRHVTFILGLAGSGKSHVAGEICSRTGAAFFEGLYGSGKNALTKATMLLYVAAGGDCVVEEIAYCLPSNREAIVADLMAAIPGVQIEWNCFENDLKSANWNVKHRRNKADPDGHLRINHAYHGLYVYPDGINPRPITRVGADGAAA